MLREKKFISSFFFADLNQDYTSKINLISTNCLISHLNPYLKIFEDLWRFKKNNPKPHNKYHLKTPKPNPDI